MMSNWENIIKGPRDRKGKVGRGKEIPESVRPGRVRRPTQTRIKGGNPIEDLSVKDVEEEDFPDYKEERERLAEMTRSDLMDAFMDKLAAMSTQEIIDILVETKGKLGDAV